MVQEIPASGNNADMLTGLGIDELLTRTDSNGLQSMVSEALGSTVGLVNSAGSLATQYTYQPFGMPASSGGTSTNPYQFTGREFDPGSAYGSNLYYLRGRYYNPVLQRFISADPLGFGGGDVNLYAYVGNDPADFVDALGLKGGPPSPIPPNPNVKTHPVPGGSGDDFGTPAPGEGPYPSGFAMVTDTPPGVYPGGTIQVHLLAPFKRLPSNPDESPGEGWVQKGPRGNWFYPPTGQSLSPDLEHVLPKGPHWDLQRRGSDRKWSLRMFEDQLQFYLESGDVWLPIEELPLELPLF